MDAFLLRRDSYRPSASASAGYGAPAHPFQAQNLLPRPGRLNPWTSLPLPTRNSAPLSSFYARRLNHPALLPGTQLPALGASSIKPVFPREYARPAYVVPRRLEYPERFKSTPLALRSLGPRRNSFKRTGVGKDAVKTVLGRKKAVDVDSKQRISNVSIEALAEEVRALHALWRTGVYQTSSNTAVEEQKSELLTSEQGKPYTEESKNATRRRNENISGQQEQVAGISQTYESPSAKAEPIVERKAWSISEQPAHDIEGCKGWGIGLEKVKAEVPPVTEEEELSVDLQRQACEHVTEFLSNFSEDDESESEFFSQSDEEADGDQKQTVEGREEKAFEFFSKLLVENKELHKLYVERCNNGKFECLVCSGIGGKMIKRFGDLVSLVMHASKILKTKRRPEHRGYGRAVCAVLGWDPLRNPSMPKNISIRPRGCILSADEPIGTASGQVTEV